MISFRKLSLWMMVCAVLILVPLSLIWAHGTGASLETVRNGFLLDIGYAPEEAAAGDPIRFDLRLLDAQSDEPIVFSDAWVRIHQGRTTYFAGDIHTPEIGEPGFVYTFPQRGEYELSVRFQKDGEPVVEDTFTLSVEAGESEKARDMPLAPVLFVIAGFALGAGGSWALMRTLKSYE